MEEYHRKYSYQHMMDWKEEEQTKQNLILNLKELLSTLKHLIQAPLEYLAQQLEYLQYLITSLTQMRNLHIPLTPLLLE